jgi:MFS family permease
VTVAVALLIGINFLAFIGIQASRIVFSLYALSLGASPSAVGGILATLFIFPVFFSWPAGTLSDRYGPVRLLVPSLAVGALGMTLPHFLPSLASLYIAGALAGLVITTVTVTVQNLIGVLSTPENRAANFSNLTLFGSATMLLGPLLGGLAIDRFGHSVTCLAIGAMLVLSIGALWRWGHTLPKGSAGKRTRANLLSVLGDRRLWPMFVISSLSQVGMDTFQAFVPIHSHNMGLSASVIGVVMAVFASGMMVVRTVMTQLVRWARGEARLLSACFFVALAAFFLVPLAPGAVTLSAVGFCFGLTLGCIQPLVLMLMFESAEEGRAGEAIGLRLTINNIARIVTPALFGLLASAASLMAVFWVSAGLMGVAGGTARPRRSSS